MTKPRLLDLFCGAGGCTKGYQDVGFYVVGVDINPQPRYCGDEFHQADALEFPLEGFDVIHASPPCQAFTAYRRTGLVGDYPNLIPPMRERLSSASIPWVMENVFSAPLKNPLILCGSMFDLDVQRHRYFEAVPPLRDHPWPCRHKIWSKNRYPGGRSKEQTGSNRGLVRKTCEVGTWDIPLPLQQKAMGIDWMNLEELSESIPPAYTQFIGEQLMAHLQAEKVSNLD